MTIASSERIFNQLDLRRSVPWLVAAVLVFSAVDVTASESVGDGIEYRTVKSADGVAIRYDVYGAGLPALVLVHGWSCDRTYWSEQVGPLSVDYTVITIDLGGHGESGHGRDDWTIASFGEHVAAVVEAFELDSVVLVGHSMGGDVIFQAARLLPGQVDALVMLDTYKRLGAWRSDSEFDEIVAEFEADFPAVTERYVRSYFPAQANQALVDRIAADMAAAPPEVALSAMRSSFRHAREVPALIEALDIPVVTINPDDAPTDRASMSAHGVDVIVMTGVGHFPGRFESPLADLRPETTVKNRETRDPGSFAAIG